MFIFPGLQHLLFNEFGLRPSISVIKAARRKIGWIRTGPRYCQAVREPNRLARLAFAQKCIQEVETFDNVIFTDESSIWMERHGKLCFRKKDMPAKDKPKVKHPFKVHVWARTSKRGATEILLFTGIMRK